MKGVLIMKYKKIASLLLCIILIFCVTGCRKNINDLSSNFSNQSVIADINSQLGNLVNDSSNINDITNTLNNSSDNATSTEQEAPINMEEQYGFSTLKTMDVKCIKDIPYGDAEYEITAVRTNKDTNIGYMCDITCNQSEIKITDKSIFVPYEFKQKNNDITLTATHRPTGIKCNVKITFDKWNLVFEDNFDGTELNTEIWNIWDEMRDWRYSYSKDSIILDGKGHLINRVSILETLEDYGNARVSGAITTKDKYETTYGYFEIRMKPHLTTGLMGAFWLMAGDMGDKDAPDDNSSVNGAEIDIVETLYNKKIPSHAVHWDGYTNTKSYGNSSRLEPIPEVFDGNFHTFAVRWTPDEYVFLVDGKVTDRTEAEGGCNQPGYMLISTHFNESWAGEVTMKPGEHTDMVVDYVRIYQTTK